MKKVSFVILILFAVSITGCGSDNKSDAAGNVTIKGSGSST